MWLLVDLDSDLLVSEFEGFVSKKRLSSSRQHNTRVYSRRTYNWNEYKLMEKTLRVMQVTDRPTGKPAS